MKIHQLCLAALCFLLTACQQSEQPTLSEQEKGGKEGLLAEITFQVDDPEFNNEGPGPYVNLAEPEKDLNWMRKPDEIVYPGNELTIVLDYPLRKEFGFVIRASSTKGFTRSELVRAIAVLYQQVYAEEARTSKIPVMPMEQRVIQNRNETNGTYGIWGHDLSDLVLHTIEITRAADGKVQAYLGIDS